jgi:hypothetical protein
MPHFVILEHDHPSLHWDLMLERGESLRTWRLPDPLLPGVELAAEPTFDHRRHYLDYEGSVSGGRGRVVRWDRGEYVVQLWSEHEIQVVLAGQRAMGLLTLRFVSAERWRLLLQPQPPA